MSTWFGQCLAQNEPEPFMYRVGTSQVHEPQATRPNCYPYLAARGCLKLEIEFKVLNFIQKKFSKVNLLTLDDQLEIIFLICAIRKSLKRLGML